MAANLTAPRIPFFLKTHSYWRASNIVNDKGLEGGILYPTEICLLAIKLIPIFWGETLKVTIY